MIGVLDNSKPGATWVEGLQVPGHTNCTGGNNGMSSSICS